MVTDATRIRADSGPDIGDRRNVHHFLVSGEPFPTNPAWNAKAAEDFNESLRAASRWYRPIVNAFWKMIGR